MHLRERFERQLQELRDAVLRLGGLVEEELTMALEALDRRDVAAVPAIVELDGRVNHLRYEVEQQCVALLVTQQPAAHDLRITVSALNIVTDLERMGDQAKGIARVVERLQRHPGQVQPPELMQMGELAKTMLRQALLAYSHENVDLARETAARDDEVDLLYARVFSQIMFQMAEFRQAERIEGAYEVLRAAREIERYADLAANVAERVVYIATGSMEEINTDRDDSAG